MPKVYCVTRYRNDITPAEKWGSTIELVESPISPFATDRMAWNISPQLMEFQAEDYFLLTGPVSGYIIGGLLLFEKFEQINVLRYNPSVHDYVPEIIKTIKVEKKPSAYPPGRIFVLNFIGHPILSALDYSNQDIPQKDRIVTLTTGDIDQSDIENLTKKIADKLADYQEGDMILLSGPAILHIILAAVLHSYDTNASLLLFNPKRQEYHRREIVLPHLRMVAQLALKEAVA